jgi:pimeloyl-ACP methyl ester carboxylesterase
MRTHFIRFLVVLLSSLLLTTSALAEDKHPTIVLVHGAFADGSSWEKVIPLLQARGLKVVAVQNPLTSLADDVAAAKRVIDTQPGPVVLVGHSWAGTVITQAGASDKVQALVYIAAFAPDVGQSTGELGKPYPPPPGLATARPDAVGFLYLPTENVIKDFVPDQPVEIARIIDVVQGPIAVKAFEDKVTVAAWRTKPSYFVVAEKDRMIQPDLERAMAKKIHAATTSLPSGHVPMLSKPQEVANVILTAAKMK